MKQISSHELGTSPVISASPLYIKHFKYNTIVSYHLYTENHNARAVFKSQNAWNLKTSASLIYMLRELQVYKNVKIVL